MRTCAFISTALLFALGATVLAGCESSNSPTPTTTAPVVAQSAAEEPPCADLTGEEAVAKWGPGVPQAWNDLPVDDPRNWNLTAAITTTYDPCSPLSWIVLSNSTGAISGPRHVMVFHQGTYVGTLTSYPFVYEPQITRTGEDTIEVTWPVAADGDNPTSPSTTTTATFTTTATAVNQLSGELPPQTEARSDDTPPPPPAPFPGAWPGAGGPIPEGATPAAVVFAPGETSFNYETAAVLKSPSGNILCDLQETWMRCLIKNYTRDLPYGKDEGGFGRWAMRLYDSDMGNLGSQSEGTPATEKEEQAEVVEYGHAVYFGSFVCGSLETGLTCWNTVSGHGAFMNRAETLFF